MGKLVTVKQVRERINFDSILDVDAVIDSIISNLTPDLEQVLRTKFAYGEKTDVWYVQNSFTPGPQAWNTWLFCSQGLVKDLTSITYAPQKRLLTNGTGLFDWAEIVGDGEKGSILVADVNLSGNYVRATYTAGLDLGEGEDSDVFQDVPEWLQEMAILLAVRKLDSVHPGVRFEDNSPVSVDRLTALVKELVGDHVRYDPRAVKPF